MLEEDVGTRPQDRAGRLSAPVASAPSTSILMRSIFVFGNQVVHRTCLHHEGLDGEMPSPASGVVGSLHAGQYVHERRFSRSLRATLKTSAFGKSWKVWQQDAGGAHYFPLGANLKTTHEAALMAADATQASPLAARRRGSDGCNGCPCRALDQVRRETPERVGDAIAE
jgi:hypothetical protein